LCDQISNNLLSSFSAHSGYLIFFSLRARNGPKPLKRREQLVTGICNTSCYTLLPTHDPGCGQICQWWTRIEVSSAVGGSFNGRGLGFVEVRKYCTLLWCIYVNTFSCSVLSSPRGQPFHRPGQGPRSTPNQLESSVDGAHSRMTGLGADCVQFDAR